MESATALCVGAPRAVACVRRARRRHLRRALLPHQLQLLIPTLRLAPHLEAAVLALAVAAASQAAAALHPAVSVWAASRV